MMVIVRTFCRKILLGSIIAFRWTLVGRVGLDRDGGGARRVMGGEDTTTKKIYRDLLKTPSEAHKNFNRCG
jgi:hypothetical protein